MGHDRDGRSGCSRREGVAAVSPCDTGACPLRITALGTTLAVVGTAHAAVNSALLRRLPSGPSTNRSVCVLIPARNEAATIGPCLDALGRGHHVIVYDDESSDATAVIAAAHGARVITGPAPPPEWTGKSWACARLAAATDADVLVFLDADVVVAPGGVDAAVAALDRLGLDLVSPQPRQLACSAAERIVQPLLWWSILTFLPLRVAERSRRSSLAAANGQFLVVRRAAYQRTGGHGPGAAPDDLALLRALRRSGGRGIVVDGTGVASCRMYSSWSQMRDGYAKSLWSAFGGVTGSAAACTLLGVAYVVPAVAALRGSRLGLVGYLTGVAGRLIVAVRCGDRQVDAVAHPVSVIAFAALVARSHRLRRSGRLRWKGRPLVS